MVKRLIIPLRRGRFPWVVAERRGQRLSAELDAALREARFNDLRAAHAPVSMAIDAERHAGHGPGAALSDVEAGDGRVGPLPRRARLPRGRGGSRRRAREAVALTERGWAAVDLGERVIGEYDLWLAAAVGADQVVRLRETLYRIVGTPPRRERDLS